MNTSRPLRTLLASSLASALLLQGAVAFADDTEIFFGGNAIADGIRPNVLFLLDDSGSMAWCSDSSATQTCSDNSKQRMTILKQTMVNLLDTTSGINAGLMVLNNGAGSPKDATLSRLLFPTTNIDAPYNLKLSSPEIKVSADDASRYSSATNIIDPTLLMGKVKDSGTLNTVVRSLGSPNTYSNNNSTYYLLNGSTTYTCSVKMDATTKCPSGVVSTINARSNSSGNDGLLLFRNLNIPAGVTITSAKLAITPDSDKSATTFNVALLNSKTPGAFNHSDDAESPVDTSLFTNNTQLTSSKVLNAHQLELKTLLQALQTKNPTSNPIGDLAIRLRSTNNINFRYLVGDNAEAPILTITYTGSENTPRSTGLRFQTVSVPQGATITSAKLAFVPASSDDRSAILSVTAQASDNADLFTTSEDFTGRSKTVATLWDAPEWRTENPPVLNEGANVTAQVQSVVSRAGWCGNNAMAFFLTPNSGDGSRTAISQDGHNGLKPTLNISYTGGDAGCITPIVDISLIDGKDDARQYYQQSGWWPANNTAMQLNENTLAFSNSSTSSTYTKTILGARFQKLPFKTDAQVLETSVIVTPDSADGTNATANVYFEMTSNSAAFSSTDNDLGKRTATTKTSCTFTSKGPGIPVTCSAAGLASALQSVLTSGNGWKDGNALSVFLAQTSASSSLQLRSQEYSSADAIRLQVKLGNGSLTDNSYKVRDHLKGLVNSMVADNGTPIIPQLTQAAQYYTDLSGKHKGPTSPIESSCQTNFLVLMTDGQANGNSDSAINTAESLAGTTCSSRTNSGETCGPELASWLNKTDQSTSIPDKNIVSTHTIGFALQTNNAAKQFLVDVATAGGGKSYDASNASQLANAFNSILQEVLSTNTTFVNTTAPVNSFNRQDNKDQLYFSLFRPSESDRWVGNLKRYRFGIPANESSYAILDADGSKAINPATGFFASNTRSYWDDARDGDDVGKGGTAKQLPTPTNRKLFTYLTGSTSTALTNSQNSLNTGNALITRTQLGNTVAVTSSDALLKYIRGLNSDTTERKAVGDPIHSSPRLLTYGCKGYDANKQCLDSTGKDNADQYAIIGTNEGFVQMFDTSNGQEVFGFMPEVLLKNIGPLYDNAKSTAQKQHPYGMDNTVTVWVNDINRNGVIYGDPSATPQTLSGLNTGEGVYAFASMGRGGRDIYALDITDKSAPTLMWQIKGGTTAGFEKLGQTWSAPIKTKIKVGSTITDVLIFAGGYNAAQDELNQADSVRTADNTGNALYIVNARTGALIWSVSNATGHSVQLSKMKYSIPSTVRVVDIQQSNGALISDADQLADQIFFGDMGGQIWRFFINNGESGAALVSPGGTSGDGVFANLGGTDAASARRFYHEPDVALVLKGGVRQLAVSIGSGYRGHPLNKFITDRFYSLRTTLLTRPVGAINEGTLIESNLYDATANQIQSSTNATRIAAETALAAGKGWYITLNGYGEKVLSRALTVGGEIFVNTYEPSMAAGQCKASVGLNRAYSMKLDDASPTTTAANSNGTYADRFTTSNSQGIAGDPQLFCQENNCLVLRDPSLPPIKAKTPPLGPLYWSDSLNSN
jgi:type IV pilus assembly protein PilY1